MKIENEFEEMKTELERLKVLNALKLGYRKLTTKNASEAEFKNIEEAKWK